MSSQTGWEEFGRWSTRSEEATFLQTVADETAMTLTEAGRSVVGHPIWRAEIGTGPAIMIVGALHPNEPSGREAALMWLRDLAYSTDPDVLTYLDTHRIVIIPTANPDGLTGQRDNSNGVNLNRDFFKLTQPETRAVQSVLRDVDPDIILDLHEAGADAGYEWRPYAGGLPGAHPDIQDLSTDCMDEAKTVLSGLGFQSLDYPVGSMPWSGLSVVAAAHHALSVLSEPGWRITTQAERIELSIALFETTLAFHRDQLTDIHDARTASRAAAASSTDPIPVPTRQFIGTGTVTTVEPTGPYEPEWDIPQTLLDLHGIDSTDGALSVQQEARLIIAALFDPASSEYVVDDPWWNPTPTVDAGLRLTVRHDGVLYPVRDVWTNHDGVRRHVTEAWTARDGARVPVMS